MVSEYAPLTIRLPPDVRSTLKAVAFVRSEPVSRIVEQALGVYLKTLTRSDRALVKTITKRHEK
jgi:predicted transcriptional regulator